MFPHCMITSQNSIDVSSNKDTLHLSSPWGYLGLVQVQITAIYIMYLCHLHLQSECDLNTFEKPQCVEDYHVSLHAYFVFIVIHVIGKNPNSPTWAVCLTTLWSRTIIWNTTTMHFPLTAKVPHSLVDVLKDKIKKLKYTCASAFACVFSMKSASHWAVELSIEGQIKGILPDFM